MPASIWAHRQSTLPDGRVIVSGGSASANGFNPFNTVYIYTPKDNEWKVVATMPASFSGHGQSVLNDGRAMVSGGRNGSSYYATTYIYNSDSNIWASASPMPAEFWYHRQSTLNDNRVMANGGYPSGINARNTVYMYNLNNNIWVSASPMPNALWGQGQSNLMDGTGRILVSGGGTKENWASPVNNTYIYNYVGNTWSSVKSFPIAIDLHGQSTLFDNRVLSSGGHDINIGMYNAVYMYDINADTWASASPLPANFGSHGQSVLADGRVLISGGTTNLSSGFSTAYIYTPTGWKFFVIVKKCCKIWILWYNKHNK